MAFSIFQNKLVILFLMIKLNKHCENFLSIIIYSKIDYSKVYTCWFFPFYTEL